MPQNAWPVGAAWPSVVSWPGASAWPGAPFPETVVPAVWFDGNQQAFSDAGGTAPVDTGLIRRINEPVAQGGAWTTPSDAERPFRDSNSVRFECIGAAGGYQMTRAAVGGIVGNACTLVCSFVYRDGTVSSPPMGTIWSADQNAGILVTPAIWVFYAGGNWITSLSAKQGSRNTIVVVLKPTGIDVTLIVDGVTTTQSQAVSIPSTAVNALWSIGHAPSAYLYASMAQALVVARSVAPSEAAALGSYAAAQSAPAAYPDSRVLIGAVGDSITQGVAADKGFTYLFRALDTVRPTIPLSEVADCAISGTGVTGLLAAGSTYTIARQFYSPTRVKNILIWLLGTNDLANGNSVAYTLYGTGGGANDGLYPAMLNAKAQGWKNILLTIGPRSGTMSVSQAVYNANRAALNTDIATNWATYAAAFVDTRGITNFGADGDSDNLAYYSSDKVHPVNAGHGLLAPSVAAAILSV